ncbi:Anaphase-promoting complex, subunit 10, partial [Oesophagostomum dentatum]
MRMNHPGCGQDSQGYLLCPTCRAQYLRKTPAGYRQERTRRWREFRLSTNAFDSRPEIIMRQNAIFLLDLNSSLDCDSKELLILTCNILGTVGGVLSEPSISENWITDSADRSALGQKGSESVDVKEMRDITKHARLEASSRQAMVVCLTDGSPETFWESGEEDKSRARTINVTFENCSPILLCLFIDNSRDEACRTSQVSFRAAVTDGSRKDLMSKNLDQNFCGWVKCCVASVTHVTISLKGPHNASRVRQLQVLGFLAEGSAEVIRPSASHQLFFNNTQHDAFALFQAISAQ